RSPTYPIYPSRRCRSNDDLWWRRWWWWRWLYYHFGLFCFWQSILDSKSLSWSPTTFFFFFFLHHGCDLFLSTVFPTLLARCFLLFFLLFFFSCFTFFCFSLFPLQFLQFRYGSCFFFFGGF